MRSSWLYGLVSLTSSEISWLLFNQFCSIMMRFFTILKIPPFLWNSLNFLAKITRENTAAKILGITGSAGKTSLKETLCFFLKKRYKTSASKKSYNNFLGILITLLNLNLKSKFAIFEIGTSNFGEIRKLTSIVKPSHVFITNIQSTHLLYQAQVF